MNTITYNNQSQLIVTIDDISLVKKISQAVKLIKGVSSVSVSKPKTNILQSESYKAGIEDIKKGNVTTYSSSDDMFNDLMKQQQNDSTLTLIMVTTGTHSDMFYKNKR